MNLRGQSLNQIQSAQLPRCNQSNLEKASVENGTTLSTVATKSQATLSLVSEHATLRSFSTNLHAAESISAIPKLTSNRTGLFQSTTQSVVSKEHFPVWSIILIIVLLLIILLTTSTIAIICIRRSDVKVVHSSSRIELQPNNPSVKSLEIGNEKC